MRKIFLMFLFCFVFFGCNKTASEKLGQGETAIFPTWQEKSLIMLDAPEVPIEESLSENDVPYAGIVSHHLLAYKFIDDWFLMLSRHNPKIETFIILSPSHWNLSSSQFSLTYGSWDCENTKVQTDIKTEKFLLEKLNGKIEDSVFLYEHGVSSLVPFIARYFPNAKVASVVYLGEPPLDTNMAKKLAEAIAPFVARKNHFILISSDFSHHGDLEKTKKRDNMSRQFFASPGLETWQLAICDNRPAIYALSSNLPSSTHCKIQRNTNSFEISGQDPTEITSYFFCYFFNLTR